jgi:DNA-binding transcriptional regulator YiaG
MELCSIYLVHKILSVIEWCSMNGNELKIMLAELEISQADFARLIGVTSRAVALWVGDQRQVAGPAEAYLRVLQLLPQSLRQIEFNRLRQKGTDMRDGMYGISFQGQEGAGMGVMIFDDGRVYGTDTQGVRYDGDYLYDEDSGLAEVKVKVTFPPNVRAAFGISNPYEWAFDITTSFYPKQRSGPIEVCTSIGQPISAQFAFLRPLPEAG